MPNPLFDLSGKCAVVTGASYGLGIIFATALSAAGARVVLAARSTEKLEEVARRIARDGGEAMAIACDVADAAQVRHMVEEAWRQWGRIDVLVNNAGVVADGGIMPEKTPDELFDHTVRVNLNGLWYCCRETGSRMLADGKGGSIINIASILGLGGLGDVSASYQASKAAVVNLTRNLALSWGNRGVRVNAIAPGWFPSEMTAGVFGMPGFLEWAKSLAAMKRIGNPEELVGPLLFLASAASSFVTGHTLVVDGGYSAGVGSCSLPDSVYQTLAAAVPHGLGKPITRAAGGAE